MLIDLKLDGKTVMVIGGGAEAYRKVQSVLDSGAAAIWLISKDFSDEVLRLGETKKVALLKTEIKDAKAFMDSLNPKPDMLRAATNNSELNLGLVNAAKTWGSTV